MSASNTKAAPSPARASELIGRLSPGRRSFMGTPTACRITAPRQTSGREIRANGRKPEPLLGEHLVLHGDHSGAQAGDRSEEHTSELQSQFHLVCRLLLEKKK